MCLIERKRTRDEISGLETSEAIEGLRQSLLQQAKDLAIMENA